MAPNQLWLMLFCICLCPLQAQWSLHSDLFISGGNEMHIAFAETYFIAGKIITERHPEKGIVSFAKNSSWKAQQPSAYVDGVVRIYHHGNFDFPVGNATHFSPISVRNLFTEGYFQMEYTSNYHDQFLPQDLSPQPFSEHFWSWETPFNKGYGYFNVFWNASHQLVQLRNINDVEQLQLGFLNENHWQPIEGHLASHPWAETTAINLTQGQLQTIAPITFGQKNALTFLWNEEPQFLTSSYRLPIISQVITPNGDGINDLWKIEHFPFNEQTTIHVYDQYGQEVFKNVGNYNNTWQGHHFLNGQKLPEGAYYYIINSGTKKWKGWVYLKWKG